MAAAGGKPMGVECEELQYFVREHMMETGTHLLENELHDFHRNMNNGFVLVGEKLHIRWNSQKGRIFIDGSHLSHDLELGDEVMIDNKAPPLKMFAADSEDSDSDSDSD